MEKPTRKNSSPIKVYCLPDERKQIIQQATAAGLSVAAYLRNVGLGYQIRGLIDNKQVEELARINGDLGRLGGLLKLWLTDDPRAVGFGAETIRAVLVKIEETQAKMHEVMRTVVMPKAGGVK